MSNREALADFVPQMVSIFGENFMEEIQFPDGIPGVSPKADFVYPCLFPAVFIEHKVKLTRQAFAKARHQLISYVAQAHYLGKISSNVMGVVADGAVWWSRDFYDGTPTGLWEETDADTLRSKVRGRHFKIHHERQYSLKPYTVDRARYQRERYQLNPERHEQKKIYQREYYANNPEFRKRKADQQRKRRAAAKKEKEWC